MRKLTVLAISLLLVTGSAFAQRFVVPGASPGPGSAPATLFNDDSCDIGVTPAATLLLPYFEVDLGTAGTGRTTAFSITNVSPYPQVAHVTLWTDWTFAVIDFNIFLTGYDVQPINLYDVIVRGFVGSPNAGQGPSIASPNARDAVTGLPLNPGGAQPRPNTTNPNFTGSIASDCAANRIPGPLPPSLVNDARLILSRGVSSGAAISCLNPTTGAQRRVGTDHGANVARGYMTIDVARTCSTALPTDTTYYGPGGDILYDNVLIGDYYDINQNPSTGAAGGNYAGGNPMVHIRAIPEGLPGGTPTNLPYTFYQRWSGGLDRRQPLPALFAARYLTGTASLFETQFKIWREGVTTAANGNCSAALVNNSLLGVSEFIRFDERENAVSAGGDIVVSPAPGQLATAETGRYPIAGTGSIFPGQVSTDGGGWIYMNLNNGGVAGVINPATGNTQIATTARPSQNWVVISQFAEGRYGVDYDAAWLGNGCTGAIADVSAPTAGGPATAVVGPARTVCQTFINPDLTTTTTCTTVNTTP